MEATNSVEEEAESKDGIWVMEISTADSLAAVLGSYKVLSIAVKEWEAWRADPARLECEIITIRGFMDNYARSPVEFTKMMTQITGLTMREEYR